MQKPFIFYSEPQFAEQNIMTDAVIKMTDIDFSEIPYSFAVPDPSFKPAFGVMRSAFRKRSACVSI
jgi:hypothetical protein